MTEPRIFPDREALSGAAAEHFTVCAEQALAARGRFCVALAGGSTPRAMYRLLAEPPLRDRIAWEHVHVFWGDERCVPPSDERSNFRMAWEALLQHVPVPPAHVHAPPVDRPPDVAARRYEATLREVVADGQLDLVLLGMGDDGHTASIFPGTPAVEEQQRWVTELDPNRRAVPPSPRVEPAVHRLTFTAPLINRARQVTFLVAGSGKAPALRRLFHESPPASEIPAILIRPTSGQLLWLLDQSAAGSR